MSTAVYFQGQRVEGDLPVGEFLSDEVGIFESMRTYRGQIFRLEEHLERLFESQKTAGFSKPISKKDLKIQIQEALKSHLQNDVEGDLFLRITFYDCDPLILITSRKHSPVLYREGVALTTSPVKRSLSNAAFPEAKTAAYQNAVLASLEPSHGETYEWVFLDFDGYVTEVRIGNIFIVKYEGRNWTKPILLTPPTVGILNGVTRKFVIECALQASIAFKETRLTRHEIYNAHEAFLTNTSWEILPIRMFDGRKIGEHVSGPITKRIKQIFNQQVKRECP